MALKGWDLLVSIVTKLISQGQGFTEVFTKLKFNAFWLTSALMQIVVIIFQELQNSSLLHVNQN